MPKTFKLILGINNLFWSPFKFKFRFFLNTSIDFFSMHVYAFVIVITSMILLKTFFKIQK